MPGSDSKDIEPEGRYLESLISINVRRPMGELDGRGAPELDSERVPMSIFGGARRVRSSAKRGKPSTRNPGDGETNTRLVAKTLFSLYTVVFPMTLVVAPMLFNCGGAMHNSDAAVCTKTNCYKLAVQQNANQACRFTPVKRDTGNATIHRNGTKPAPFASNRGSHLNDLGLVRFHRATAENQTSDSKP